MIAMDASALLAFLFREPGHEAVRLEGACFSAVNLAEVLGRFARDGHNLRAVLARLAAAGLEIVPFGAEQSVLAAALFPAARTLGLSLGDHACLALARSRGIPAQTTGRSWAKLKVGIEIRLIR